MRRLFPPIFYNPVTLTGAFIAAISLGLIVFLTLIELLASETKPYMGIITFIILPFFMIIGFILILYGVKRERKLIKKRKGKTRSLPVIDFNNPQHRKTITYITFGALFLIIFSAFGSYKAYEYTETDEFCGTTCHSVMNPEFTAFKYSPHARVHCVDCHIGSGAQWYIRSKLSGAYQVYAVLFNKYTKPIETPIKNLRPAQGTCEQCHWPKVFLSEKLRKNTYFLSDEQNTKWSIDLLMKIGGGNIEVGQTSGIHWHMNIANEVKFYASDRRRQVIPYVRVKHADGKITEYRSTEEKFDEADITEKNLKRMDCIDCHNRPTHIYHDPYTSMNDLMSVGWVDPSLPYIKSVTVEALEKPYTTKEIGLDSIKTIIEEFYKKNYPEIAEKKHDKIEEAIVQTQKIYNRNYFPSMKVDWKGFPNNIGHLYSNGCFRCHDGNHVSEDGKVLTRDCNTCHTILAQKFEKDSLRISLAGIEYKHPVDIGEEWKETNCSECHSDAE